MRSSSPPFPFVVRRVAIVGAWLPLLLACGEGPRDVTVQVRLPDLGQDMRPVSGLPMVFLPYDRDSLLDLLEAEAAEPRPHVEALDSLFQAFREPYQRFARAAHYTERYRDTLAVLRATFDTLDRADEAYHVRFQLFAQLQDSLRRAETARETAVADLRRAREELVPRTDSLRIDVRAWERSTFSRYDSIVTEMAEATGRLGMSDTTDARGEVSLRVPRGPWWVYARAWDETDPNSEWYWNVRIAADTVILNDDNGLRLPTY